MPELKSYSGGTWRSSTNGPVGVLAKNASNSAFGRFLEKVWVDNDSGGWLEVGRIRPAPFTAAAATNNGGRIDLSWDIADETNIASFVLYYSTDNVNFSASALGGPSLRSAIFGRAGAPVTYYFFLRAVSNNGTYSQSAVFSVSVPGITSWSFSHSRAQSGWHTRSFTFTHTANPPAGVTVKNLTSYLFWRPNAEQGWTLVTFYSENNTNTISKTFTFSAYDHGRAMFRVVTYATDDQTKQNDGSTGTGYVYGDDRPTTELTAADISGGTPTLSLSAPSIGDPGYPGGPTNNRQMVVTVGFDANVDRSEYDSGVIYFYRYNFDIAQWIYSSEQSVDLSVLKSNQSIRQETSKTFSSLDAGWPYLAVFQVNDDQGADTSASQWTYTYAAQVRNYTYISSVSRTGSTSTATAGDYWWMGSGGTYIGDAPYGAASGYGVANLRDGSTGTHYVTASISSNSSLYQKLRFYRFQDYSINSSSVYNGDPSNPSRDVGNQSAWGNTNVSPGYDLNWIQVWTPYSASHTVYLQIYNYNTGIWLGYSQDVPEDGYRVGKNTFTGNWQHTLTVGGNYEGLVLARQPGTNNWQTDFDIRVTVQTPRVYSGFSGYRLGLSEMRINTTWYSIYDNYTTTQYTF